MGGHQEYYASSALFFSTTGLFLICFESRLLQLEFKEMENEYYGNIGTFVDLVSQVSSESGLKLKIALVATKSENSDQCPESLANLLEITRDHLTSASSQVFFLNEVITTSSKEVTRNILERVYNRVAIMCSDPKLKTTPDEIRPMSWHKFLGVVSQEPQRSLEEAKYIWQNEKMEAADAENISPEEIDTLKKFLLLSKAVRENSQRKSLP